MIVPAWFRTHPTPRHGRTPREQGSALATTLVLTALMVGVLLPLLSVVATVSRGATDVHRGRRALLAAESGIRLSQYEVNSVKSEGNLTGRLGPVSYGVVMESLQPDYAFRVTAVGRCDGVTSTVHSWMRSEAPATAAFSVHIDSGGNGTATQPMRIIASGEAMISGMNHDPSGVRLGDQADALPALGIDPNKRFTGLSLSVGGPLVVVEGLPATVDSLAPYRGVEIENIVKWARTHADSTIPLVGTVLLSGQIGAPDDYRVFYINGTIGILNRVVLADGLKGFGLLVVEVAGGGGLPGPFIQMEQSGEWNGLVVIRMTGGFDFDTDDRIVLMKSLAKLRGAIVLDLSGGWLNRFDGAALEIQNWARLLWSKEACERALGRVKANLREVAWKN